MGWLMDNFKNLQISFTLKKWKWTQIFPKLLHSIICCQSEYSEYIQNIQKSKYIQNIQNIQNIDNNLKTI